MMSVQTEAETLRQEALEAMDRFRSRASAMRAQAAIFPVERNEWDADIDTVVEYLEHASTPKRNYPWEDDEA